MLSTHGPNVSAAREDLFQTDRDIALANAYTQKSQRLKGLAHNVAGNPVDTKGKILTMSLLSSNTASSPESVFIGQANKLAKRIELSTGKVLTTFKGHSGPVCSMSLFQVAEQAPIFVTGSWDKTAKIWDTEVGKCLTTLTAHKDYVKSVLAHSEHIVFTGSTDRTALKWDLRTPDKPVASFGGIHRRGVEALAVSSDGTVLYTASSDKSVIAWDLSSQGVEPAIFDGHLTSVYALDTWEDNLFTGSADNSVYRIDVETLQRVCTYKHPDWVRSLKVHGNFLATGCRDTCLRLWNLGMDECVIQCDAHLDEVSSIAFTSNGSHVVTGCLDGFLRSWSVQDLASWYSIEPTTQPPSSMSRQVDEIYLRAGEEKKEEKDTEKGNTLDDNELAELEELNREMEGI